MDFLSQLLENERFFFYNEKERISMIKLADYTISKELFTGNQSIVYRGKRNQDHLPVIIKLLNQEHPSEKLLSDFNREYEIARDLSDKGTVPIIELLKVNKSLALVMEDIEGISLSQLKDSLIMDLSDKLSLAVKIAHNLSLIHKKQIIHKDINPSNIIWNRETGRLEIIDFGIAAEISRERAFIMQTGILEGTLDYLSPEQTGRINRPIDSRSDLYSLGVTLYELFTGRLPFQWEDESEIIYCHIAKEPEAPHKLKSSLPEVLSQIIMKLLAKDGEQRYQMALGLKKDLEICLENLNVQGEITPFEIGKFDISDQFLLPNKLYGRQDELEEFSRLFKEVRGGSASMLIVEGHPGVGKSSLVQEFSKSVALHRGSFTSGKFDQQEQNIPLKGVIEALKGVVQGLLLLSEDKLQVWKRRILEALQKNAGIIIEIIPELEQILGAQPPPIELNPIEAQNRFIMVCRDFINVFAREESPLVIFLDDLQWSDIGTLDFLKYMAGSRSSSHLLFVLAYRQNNFNSEHPLQPFLEEIKKESLKVSSLLLEPLSVTDIDHMLADTFRRPPDEESLLLANLVFQKTRGNPYFMAQLLTSLYHGGFFNPPDSQGRWTWDLSSIEDVDISDNVIDLLNWRIEQLSPSVLELLKLASCIGDPFDLEHLSLICDRSPRDIGNTLWPAVRNEILLPLNQNYRLLRLEEDAYPLSSVDLSFSFQHDRIQQVVYSMIPEEDKQRIHLEIGQKYALYQKNRNKADFVSNMVNHMNMGRALIRDLGERKILRDLNTLVGSNALKSTAFSLAANNFTIAESLLSEQEWLEEPEEWYKALFNLAEALMLSGELKKAEEISDSLLPLSESPLRQATARNLKARILEFQGRIPETIEEIRKGLLLLNINLPEDRDDTGRKIGEGIAKMHKIFAEKPVEHLAELPLMEDKKIKLAMELLYNVIPPALQFAPPLYILSSLMMLELTQNFGVSPESCKCFIDIAITQCPSLDDFSIGYRLGEAAFLLLKRLNAETLKPAVYFGFSFLSYRNVHFREALQYLDMAIATGLQTGDLQHAAYARVHKLHLFTQLGLNLKEFRSETERSIDFLNEMKAGMPLLQAKINQYMLSKYQSEKEIDKDQEMISTIEASRNIAFLWRFYQYNAAFYCFHDQWEEANKWSRLTDQFLFVAQSDYSVPEHFFFKGLILLRLWEKPAEKEESEKWKNLEKIMDELKKVAQLCPDNFSHKYHFLCAEIAALNKAPQGEILHHFEKALNSIKDEEFIHMKALIYEAMGRYWKLQGNEIISKAYITESCFLYRNWGALRKVPLMEARYPYLKSYFQGSPTSSLSSQTLVSSSIDMASILKAMQVLSGEIRIEKLLRRFMHLILENAGARQGALLLVNEADNALYIEAERKHFDDEIEVLQSLPYRKSPLVCPEIIQYVLRSRNRVVLGKAWQEGEFRNSKTIQDRQIKSILSIPVIYRNKLMGVIYLEHDLAENVFTEERIRILEILSSQASISIENARLYVNMEKKVAERTAQLNQANDRFRQLSILDPLTSLHNRRYISEFVSEITMNFITKKERLQNNREQRDISIDEKVMGIFLIDLDHFKLVNDTYGHSVGDQVLIRISKTLKKQIRIDDYIVRWGGEEFLIILNNTDPSYLDQFALRILKAVKETPLSVSAEKILHKSCSIGYSMMPIHQKEPHLLNLEQAINLSDFALYLSKERGRDCASRISLKSQETPSPDCREYLRTLNKSDPVKEEFIEVTTLKNRS